MKSYLVMVRIDTSRELTDEEQDAMRERFNEHFLALELGEPVVELKPAVRKGFVYAGPTPEPDEENATV